MPSLKAFLTPVRFQGADANAYRRRAAERDRNALRFVLLLAILAQVSRFLVESYAVPDILEPTVILRACGVGIFVLMFAATFHPGFVAVRHPLIAVGFTVMVAFASLGNVNGPSHYPYVTTGVWLVVFLLGVLSFERRLVALVLVLVVVLPAVAISLSVNPPMPVPAMIALSVSISTLTLGMSYIFEQYWRRAFRVDLALAVSHEELRRTHRELAAAYVTLTQTQDQLVRAERTAALGRLVANVAHRINTPVGNILAVASHSEERVRRFTRLVQAGTIRRSDLNDFLAETAEGIGMMLSNAQRTATLIDTFRRLAAGGIERGGRLDLGDLLVGLRPSLEATMPPGVALLVAVRPGLSIAAPWTVMEAVVSELVRNAVSHAFPGGRPGRLTLCAGRAEDGGVELRVEDDGVGIADEHQSHIFDPFYTDGTIGGGHGLGLSIVHNAVVGPLGGRIGIESGCGRGTAVTIRLPAASAGLAVPAEAGPSRRSVYVDSASAD